MLTVEFEDEELPVLIKELKDHLQFYSSDDRYLKRLIKSATTIIENFTGRSLIKRIYNFTSSGDGMIELPFPPFVKIIEIQSLRPKQFLKRYKVDQTSEITKIFFHAPLKDLQIKYETGYTKDNIPDPIKQSILTLCANMHNKRDQEPNMPINLINNFVIHRIM